MWVRSSVVSESKMTTSSSRFRNSGLKCARTAAITARAWPRRPGPTPAPANPGSRSAPACVLRKSTVRPCPSVSRPSSSTASSTSNTSGCAFSTSSSSTTAVRAAPHGLGELAALVVADVAGRGTDEAGHRVLLGVLAHVDADHRALVVEQEVRQRLGQLGLADTGRAEEQERAGRPVRVGDAGPGPAHGVGHRLHGRLLPDDPRARARPPCAAAWPSRPPSADRPGCRSRRRRRRRCRRRSPAP